MFTVLFFGDIVGRSGRKAVAKAIPSLIEIHNPDLIIANGENAAGGLGIDPKCANELFKAGIHLITTGNHVWKKKSLFDYLNANADSIIRPYNFPSGTPGTGYCSWSSEKGISVSVVNLIGRVFMDQLVDCPFVAADEALEKIGNSSDLIIVDFHAEATSEKVAMSHYLDGRAQLIVGTHTHIQTADERVLPQGSGSISDLGMCGPLNGVLGIEAQRIIKKFKTSLPSSYELAKGATQINALICSWDMETKTIANIERVLTYHQD